MIWCPISAPDLYCFQCIMQFVMWRRRSGCRKLFYNQTLTWWHSVVRSPKMLYAFLGAFIFHMHLSVATASSSLHQTIRRELQIKSLHIQCIKYCRDNRTEQSKAIQDSCNYMLASRALSSLHHPPSTIHHPPYTFSSSSILYIYAKKINLTFPLCQLLFFAAIKSNLHHVSSLFYRDLLRSEHRTKNELYKVFYFYPAVRL